MIVAEAAAGLRIVTQPDHARIAAELLSLWRREGLPDHPRRADLLFAVREHDNGWQEADAAPRIDPSGGRPYGFREVPAESRIEIWQRAVGRHREAHPYPALLIATHADRLHHDRRPESTWSAFFERLDRLAEELLESSGATLEQLEEDYRWLRLADHLSLLACGDGSQLELGPWRARRDEDQILLAPFPFAGSTTFSVPCREIPNRPYESDTDLTIELATARWQSHKIRLTPA